MIVILKNKPMTALKHTANLKVIVFIRQPIAQVDSKPDSILDTVCAKHNTDTNRFTCPITGCSYKISG